jgi:ADP-ribosylglycohydrolase
MTLPADYLERVYAGVLGKLIGVYLGRPFEGWSHERILAELGEVDYYVNDRDDLELLNHRLVVTDDDITGTFAMLRALADNGNSRKLRSAQIGEAWLNYAVEGRSIFWWGGLGNSTEHTAYLRLREGILPPRSGSAELNGKVLSEQVGAQIFIDGWAMVAPGDPELAAELARRAACVSHDGEAVHAARVIAAMEAHAFVEGDIDRLLDVAVELIPADSAIARAIADVREWHAGGEDWYATRRRIAKRHPYAAYGGVCPAVPNHALIVAALLHGDDDFQRSLMIVNTCGWDTDSNSGNLGCLLGIKNGLAAIDAGPDWRGPVADRMYLPTADGGGAITDAVTEAVRVANSGRGLSGLAPLSPKDGARFHFELPGSTQGFQAEADATVENVAGFSELGARSLRLSSAPGARSALMTTPTFIPPGASEMYMYELLASPTLYPGQTIRARVVADPANREAAACVLLIRAYDGDGRLVEVRYQPSSLAPGAATIIEWRVPDCGGQPLAEVGLEWSCNGAADGAVHLDYLTWDGTPDVTLTRPVAGGEMWQHAWVRAADRFESSQLEPLRLVQNRGLGLLLHGSRDWIDYQVEADLNSLLAATVGLAARVEGQRRYYALELKPRSVRLVKARGDVRVLAEADFEWKFGRSYSLSLRVEGTSLRANVDGRQLFNLHDTELPLSSGSVGLLCEEGCVWSPGVRVRPLPAA